MLFLYFIILQKDKIDVILDLVFIMLRLFLQNINVDKLTNYQMDPNPPT